MKRKTLARMAQLSAWRILPDNAELQGVIQGERRITMKLNQESAPAREAKDLLVHYLVRLPRLSDPHGDLTREVERLVDSIIEAAVLEMKQATLMAVQAEGERG